jgi:predicted ATPase/class 3 adenylate cyclase
MNGQLINQSQNSLLTLEDHKDFGKVIVKSLNNDFPSPEIIKKFLHEYEIGKNINIEGVRKVYGYDKQNQTHRIYLEYIPGISLLEYKSTKPALNDLLSIFISLAKAMAELHQKSIVHNHLSPENIIVKTDSLTVQIIDLSRCSSNSLMTAHNAGPAKLAGSAEYMAPEQTGRMNRVVDQRSDLYSIGIMLYEFLTGNPPFKHNDLLELVHAHIAVQPKNIAEINPNCPEPLCAITSKLLQKNADERYQSASGLQKDLEYCLSELIENKKIRPFELAQIDVSPRFHLSQKLYGREKELDLIISTFEKAALGQTHLMLVSGFSGTGKSALVSEIYKPITAKKGYFIEGKFDQFQRSIPYYAIVKAFDSLIHIMLTESSSRIERIKSRMLEVLGQEGKVLTDVIPSFELIIGKQPPIAEINSEDTQNRFNYIFQKWLSTICSEHHPIVLFIDDLQWADSASLDLLKALMQNPNNNFLCICAYRDNEVNKAHPFIITVDQLREQGTRIEEIHLDNLNLDNIENLLADSLLKDIDSIKDLAELIYKKTKGNAFFVVQFLKSLADKGLLLLNTKSQQWEWDLGEINQLSNTDNVLDFMAERIKELEPQTQSIFKVAACLGTIFSVKDLTEVSHYSNEEIDTELDTLVNEGLIIKLENTFKFTHDRIQQAIYSLIDEKSKKELHLFIGRQQLAQTQADLLDDHIFKIINNLNLGLDLIDDKEELLNIAKLNIKASKKAKLTSAFYESFEYIKNAIALLPKNPWETNYNLALQVYEEAAESAFLSGQFKEMWDFTDEILKNNKDVLVRVKAYEIQINAYKAENQLLKALSTGLEVLDELGEKFPKNASMLTVFPDLIKTVFLLRNKNLESILSLPEAKDPIKKAALRILANIAPSSYWGNPKIFPHIIFRMCQISLKHGVSAPSAFGFATYGVIMIGVLNKIKTGYPYGKIGLELIKRFNAKEWIAQVYTPVYALINIWNEHIKHTLKPLLDSYHIGLETGAIEFACINANIYCIHAYAIGKPLDKLEPEIADYSQIIRQYKQETNLMYNEVFRQSSLNLMGRADNVLKLNGAAFNEDELIADGIEQKNRTISFQIFFHRSILGNFFEAADFSFENALKAEELLDAVLAKIEVALHAFHFGLAAAYASKDKYPKAPSVLNASIKKMQHWAKNAPENFEHKLYLLLAEQARNKNEHNQARDFYDLSINKANENGYMQDEALANELAGKYHLKRGNNTQAAFYLKNAYQVYRDWGAGAKLVQLSKQHPVELKGLIDNSSLTNELIDIDKKMSLSSLDLNSVLKVSTTLSGEVVFEKMLNQLMRIVSENMGANRAALFLPKNDQLYLTAYWEVGQKEMSIQNIRLDECKNLPITLIQYIERTRLEVLLGAAWQDQLHSKDTYIKTHKAKSVLGIPLINKNILQGILYLENTLLENVFNFENAMFLTYLSSQIAVSIENAMLYNNLEKNVAERTSELADEKKKSDDLLLNILPAEIALEIKKYGRAIPRRYESVTVIFTDFVNFTKKTEQMSTEALVLEVDKYFTKFDEIIQKHNIEKIKTIGDAYMCVSGLPVIDKNHALNAAAAALEMRDFVEEVAKQKGHDDPSAFEIRIGMHSGPVVSGVVGFKKFAFDIWGDTVNTASRMESNSQALKINISQDTYDLIKDKYECEYRGLIPAKNKGDIKMYFLETPN